MARFELKINGSIRRVDVDPDTPLLWVVRDNLGMTGTKFGCGVAQCGACTMHVNGVATRTCVLPVSAVAVSDSDTDSDSKAGSISPPVDITTIEGIADDGRLSAVQQAWLEEQVPQCGYCQSGQIMAASSLLAQNQTPDDRDIDIAMQNACRCGTYPRIRKAVHRAAELLAEEIS